MENRIVALTFVQKILVGSIFNTKRGERSKCKEERESFVFSPLPSFFFIALFLDCEQSLRMVTRARKSSEASESKKTLDSTDWRGTARSLLSFQRPQQTRAETLATQATPERKFIYTLSSADRLSAAFL